MKLFLVASLFIQLFFTQAHASDTITIEPDGNAYNFVSDYQVLINAQAKDVWPVLSNLASWMYEFEMASISGEAGTEGEVLRLYPEQNFFIQITKTVPNKLLVIANLPSTFQQELSTGIATMILHEKNGQTTLSLTMSRRYSWLGEGENPMMARRQSKEFRDATKAMWQDRFLERLKTLVEDPKFNQK